jgi:hypothetical protein
VGAAMKSGLHPGRIRRNGAARRPSGVAGPTDIRRPGRERRRLGGRRLQRWPAAHVLEVGRLYRLASEKAPAGSQLYAATEEGVAVREIADSIGCHLGVPAVSLGHYFAGE